jgi:hypothetical protein
MRPSHALAVTVLLATLRERCSCPSRGPSDHRYCELGPRTVALPAHTSVPSARPAPVRVAAGACLSTTARAWLLHRHSGRSIRESRSRWRGMSDCRSRRVDAGHSWFGLAVLRLRRSRLGQGSSSLFVRRRVARCPPVGRSARSLSYRCVGPELGTAALRSGIPHAAARVAAHSASTTRVRSSSARRSPMRPHASS